MHKMSRKTTFYYLRNQTLHSNIQAVRQNEDETNTHIYINHPFIPILFYIKTFISILYKKGTAKISKIRVNTTRNTTLFAIMSSKIFTCASIIKTEEQIATFYDFISILINRTINFIFSFYIYSLYSFPSFLWLQ